MARHGAPVRVAASLLDRLDRAHALLLAAARENMVIYGLNRGVGQNKDRTILVGDVASGAAREASERYNVDLLRAHCGGLDGDLPEPVVRAILAIRLNTLLAGHTGCQRRVAEMYMAFLEHGIHPLVPATGSIGEADVALLPHIGLAMMGEGEVVYRGRRMPAAEALATAGLGPPFLRPYAKDALAITSSNAASAALAVLACHDAERLLDAAEIVAALSLEALNGNVAPLLPVVQGLQRSREQAAAAERVRAHLEGSHLWHADPARPLQDPLSFRDMSHVHGAARAALAAARRALTMAINQSDDNPAIVLDAAPPPGALSAILAVYITSGPVRGAVVPTASYETIGWTLPLQAAGVALAHVARASACRTLRLSAPAFTGLSRFLSPGGAVIAFGDLQKSVSALDAEIRALAGPVSLDFLPVAGDIEDQATNAPLVAERTGRLLDRAAALLGIELLHAAQAVDLRRRAAPGLALGRVTGRLHALFRRHVAFLERDRPLTGDLRAAHAFIAGGGALAALAP